MTVVCLGEAVVDLISPDQSSIDSAETLTINIGGTPLNVAIALKRLGVDSTFAGALSSDSFGNRILETLKNEEVGFVPEKRVHQQTRLAVINPAAEEPGFRFYGDDPADTQLKPEQILPVISNNTQALYLSVMMFHHPQAARTQRAAIVRAVEQGVPIYADPNPRPSMWSDTTVMAAAVRRLLSASRLAKLSLDDARALGWSAEPNTLILQSLTEWNTTVIVTDGANGSWAQIDGEIIHVPAIQVEERDATGAGDAFFAALIAEHLREGRITSDSMEFASVAGALATTKQGAQAGLPNRVEIERNRRSDG